MKLNENNKKLAKNIFLMFLVYFLPKIFSFFLVPVYTAYLSTEEYGVSDLIISTSSLLAPFVALATPSAILRYTIENKEDKRPYKIALNILCRGLAILIVGLVIVYFTFDIKISYLFFVFLIAGTSLLADINVSYARGLEEMHIVTVCGVGGAFVSILCNILFIVVFRWGLYGFLIASAAGYVFNTIVIVITNRKKRLLKGVLTLKEPDLQKEMLGFSIPLVFSGLSWWVVSSSDRYFVSGMCGTAANGIYSVAYKIPTILQALDNVFGQAWIFTLYDSYKSDDGKRYIAKVYDAYNFVFCAGCSFLIGIDIFLSRILFSNDFFEAWKYVPPLLLSIVFNSASSLMAGFLSIYKKTKISMNISLAAAMTNIVLNWLLIEILNDAMGAAIATAITFFVSFVLNTYYGIKLSGIQIHWKKQLFMYGILCVQVFVMVVLQNQYISFLAIMIILAININTMKWAACKWRALVKPQSDKGE